MEDRALDLLRKSTETLLRTVAPVQMFPRPLGEVPGAPSLERAATRALVSGIEHVVEQVGDRFFDEQRLGLRMGAHVADDLPLITAGILDSIATLKLVMHLEERFGITLAAHEANKDHLDTIDRISSLVLSKMK